MPIIDVGRAGSGRGLASRIRKELTDLLAESRYLSVEDTSTRRRCDKISNEKTAVVVLQLVVVGEWNIDPDEIVNAMAVQTLKRTGTNDLTFSPLL
jgi:hypothetical protein